MGRSKCLQCVLVVSSQVYCASTCGFVCNRTAAELAWGLASARPEALLLHLFELGAQMARQEQEQKQSEEKRNQLSDSELLGTRADVDACRLLP